MSKNFTTFEGLNPTKDLCELKNVPHRRVVMIIFATHHFTAPLDIGGKAKVITGALKNLTQCTCPLRCTSQKILIVWIFTT